jgi:hypothetical protein
LTQKCVFLQVFSAIGRGINAVISAIASVLTAIVSGVANVLIAIWSFIVGAILILTPMQKELTLWRNFRLAACARVVDEAVAEVELYRMGLAEFTCL